MNTLKGWMTNGFIMTAMLIGTTTFANATITIAERGETSDPCTTKVDSGILVNGITGILVNGITGILLNGVTGILVNGASDDTTVDCGILVNG